MAAKLRRKQNEWDWSEFHFWSGREDSKFRCLDVVQRESKIFTIGSCFAQNLALFLSNKGLDVSHFPDTIHFFPASIRQELEHLTDNREFSTIWETDRGLFADPFRKPSMRFSSPKELRSYAEKIREESLLGIKRADVIVITLGGIECWRHPVSKEVYLTIPFPDVFNSQMPQIAELYTQTYAEVVTDLERTVDLVKELNVDATIIFSVSPNRLTFTCTEDDILTVNHKGKSILRAALEEIIKPKKRVFYFHSFELIEYSPHRLLLFDKDHRHVSDLAVGIVMTEFLRCFSRADLFDASEYELSRQVLVRGKSIPGVFDVPIGTKVRRLIVTISAQLGLYQVLRKLKGVLRI